MSIVSYHARVDESMLEALLANPDLFWQLPEHADPAGAQLLYMDKDWAALSWLLSTKAREEHKHDIVVLALSANRNGGNDPADADAWEVAKARDRHSSLPFLRVRASSGMAPTKAPPSSQKTPPLPRGDRQNSWIKIVAPSVWDDRTYQEQIEASNIISEK